jgi:outer membrane biogenesis lipoprotein LolB
VKSLLFFVAVTVFLTSCSSGSFKENVASKEQNKTIETHEKSSQTEENFTTFIGKVLYGSQMDTVKKLMKETPYTFLGNNAGRSNYEGQDTNNVNHFVSFASYHDNELHEIVYNIEFKNNNENLVMKYQKKLFNQLIEIFGEDYDPGYDLNGHYVVDWVLEFGTVSLTNGVNFISFEVKNK